MTLRSPVTHTRVPSSAITGFTRLIDGISGASQTPGVVPHNTIPLANSHDIRRGGDIAVGLTFGPNRLMPEFSYSQENDYISWAGGLNYSLELNDKNTVISAGWSHAYDRLLPTPFSYLNGRAIKNTDDFLLGVTQIVGPETVVSANGTISHAEGYLNDPYRSVVFDESPLNPNAQVQLQGEKRPAVRDSQSLFLSATQAVKPLNASVEASYRFYHDSYGIVANTVGVDWFQKIGQAAVVSPSFRYYRQSPRIFTASNFPATRNSTRHACRRITHPTIACHPWKPLRSASKESFTWASDSIFAWAISAIGCTGWIIKPSNQPIQALAF